MTAWRRFGELRTVIESINAAAPQELPVVVIGVDYDTNAVVRNRVLSTLRLLNPIRHELKSHRRVGVSENLQRAVTVALEEIEPKAIVRIADDTPIAPDTFRLARWFAEHPDSDQYVCLALHNYRCRGPKGRACRPGVIQVTDGSEAAEARGDGCRFHGEGFIMTPFGWETYFKPNWIQTGDFQTAMATFLDDSGATFLVPELSRSTHIGRTGGGVTPEWNERVYKDAVVLSAPYEGPYEIAKGPWRASYPRDASGPIDEGEGTSTFGADVVVEPASPEGGDQPGD
jgi:hypothetical protein